MCHVSLVGIMMHLKSYLNARSCMCVLAQWASYNNLGEAGAWTKRGQSVEEPLGVEKPFWEWNIHIGEWTSRGHPAECHLRLKSMQVKVAELKSTELNCTTCSKTKDDSKRA